MNSLVSLLSGALVTASLLFTSVPTQAGPPADARMVPFAGNVVGSVTLQFDAEGQPVGMESDIAVVASHLGAGRQHILTLDLSQFPLALRGSLTTLTPAGDSVDLSFDLLTTAFEDPSLAYVGQYEVLGGTGRFTPGPGLGAPGLGTGMITGSAVLESDPENGQLRLTFAHTFSGTLLNAAPQSGGVSALVGPRNPR